MSLAKCGRQFRCLVPKFKVGGFSASESACACTIGRRYLFSGEMLGIDNFKRQQANTADKMDGLKEKFMGRMEEYMNSLSKDTVFTEDLKTVIHLTQTNEDFQLTEKMIQAYNEQSGELRFSSFSFGPVVMRLLHTLQAADKAYTLFMQEALKKTDFFGQMASKIVLMDLLFEEKKYSEVLAVMDDMKGRDSLRYPVDCTTLSAASCLKLNTAESYEWLTALLKEVSQSEHKMSPRGIVYSAMCAIKQREYTAAAEILAMRNDNVPFMRQPTALQNIKILTYAKIGRFEDALEFLRQVVSQDVPDHVTTGNELFSEVMAEVREAVVETKNKALIQQFEAAHKRLEEGGHISSAPLDQYLFRPIFSKRGPQTGYKHQRRTQRAPFPKRPREAHDTRQGLMTGRDR